MSKIILHPIQTLAQLRSDKPGYETWLIRCAANLGKVTKNADEAYRWLEINAMETDEQGVIDECNDIREFVEIDLNEIHEIQEKLDALEKWHAECMEKHGFYIHFVPDALDTPGFLNIHTHGVMESFNHLDLQIVFPLKQVTALSLMHTVVDWIKKGNAIKVNTPYDFVIQNFNVLFITATEQDRLVYRMILPDKAGNIEKNKIQPPYGDQYTVKDLP